MVKLCIFDLDGTIIDSQEDLADSVNAGLRQEGLPEHTVEAFIRFVGNGVARMVKDAMPEDVRDNEEIFSRVFDVFQKEYDARCLNKTYAYPGAPELLDELRANGVKLALLSNKLQAFTERIVRHYFGDRLDLIFGQREGIAKKPAPDGVFEIMRHFGVSAEETFFIGDSDVDVMTAKNAGIPCLGVSWGFRGREDLEKAGCELIADTMDEALQILTR
ncbi:MAG: HAD-IA family hydrolase [Oscillospiraceae bacterium]|nr:HAD-IA family hydrolase [Oscillospiraceae bacterium]